MKSIKEIYVSYIYPLCVCIFIGLYFIYSTDWICNRFIQSNISIHDLIILTNYYTIIIISLLFIIYIKTEDKVVSKLKKIFNEDVIDNV